MNKQEKFYRESNAILANERRNLPRINDQVQIQCRKVINDRLDDLLRKPNTRQF